MAFCGNCGAAVNDGAKFCAGCGAPTGVAAGTPASTVRSVAVNAPTVNRSAGNAQGLDEDQPVENLSLFGYFVKCLQHYADFNGRARRKEYWFFWLGQCIIVIPLYFVVAIMLGVIGLDEEGIAGGVNVISWLVQLAFLLPNLAVCVRRLHDVGKSGLTMLWCLTLIGALYPLILACFRDSTPGTNAYGISPKYPNDEAVDDL